MTKIYTAKYWGGETMRTAADPEKKRILDFFGGVPFTGATSGHFSDEITGEEVPGSWLVFEHGNYSWDSSDVYHFAKYDLELTPEFRAYALAH